MKFPFEMGLFATWKWFAEGSTPFPKSRTAQVFVLQTFLV